MTINEKIAKIREILCVSINPEFPPFTVKFNEDTIFGMYKVIMCMALK